VRIEPVQSDVLVVGGGLAGVRAALAARRAGASVCLVLKGKLGSSGNSPLAGGGFAAALRIAAPQDSPDVHFADTMAGGGNVNNAALVRVMVENAPAAVLELDAMGVKFARSGNQIAQVQAPAQTYPRGVRTAGGGSVQMMQVMADATRAAGVQIIEGVTVADVMLRGGAAVGALGYSPERDALIAFQAKAVILACGGAGQVYPLTSNGKDLTGDGYAMAYRAGCRLADMEFVQFTPTALAWPPEMRGMSAGGSLLGQKGAKLLNRLGERFMTKYDPERMERTTRAIASRAIFTEIVEGRGTEHGAVYLDVTEVDKVDLENISGPQIRQLRQYGIDMFRQPIELAPAVHHCMGGVVIDTRCRTDVPGLYAAGETEAGIHGANRLNSNALSEAAVFGKIAGQEAAAYAASASATPLDQASLEKARAEMEARIRPGAAPHVLIEKLRTLMLAGAGLERRAESLEAALADLKKLRAEADGVGAASPADLPRVIELRNMLEVGEIIQRAALKRTESRGAHFRADFPNQNDAEWLANIHISKTDAGPALQVVPIKRD